MMVWMIFGALAGWIASVVSRDAKQSVLSNVLVGIIGASLGGFIMTTLGYGGVNGFNIYSMIVAVIGAVISLLIYKTVATRA